MAVEFDLARFVVYTLVAFSWSAFTWWVYKGMPDYRGVMVRAPGWLVRLCGTPRSDGILSVHAAFGQLASVMAVGIALLLSLAPLEGRTKDGVFLLVVLSQVAGGGSLRDWEDKFVRHRDAEFEGDS